MTVNISKPAVNVREKLAELDKPTGIAGEAMLRAETPQEQFNLIGAGRRNIIINGNFQVSQRGDYSSATSISNVIYYLDRWEALVAGNTATLTHTNNRAKLTATSTSSVGRFGLRQTIEYETWMSGRWMTLSAKVKSNSSNAFLYVFTDDGIISRTEKHSGSGEDEFLSTTFYVADANTTMQIYARISADDGFTVSVTNGDFVEFTEVQLELGKVATPFEHRSYGEELALCQRYYQKLPFTGAGYQFTATHVGSASWRSVVRLTVPMRATPTVSTNYSSVTNDLEFIDGGTTINVSSLSGAFGQNEYLINFNGSLASSPSGNAAVLYQRQQNTWYAEADAEL